MDTVLSERIPLIKFQLGNGMLDGQKAGYFMVSNSEMVCSSQGMSLKLKKRTNPIMISRLTLSIYLSIFGNPRQPKLTTNGYNQALYTLWFKFLNQYH